MSLDQTLQALKEAFPPTDTLQPALFVGHGSPLNAIEENEFSHAWARVGSELPVPRAILCVSAHWETDGTQVTASEHPPTIHDFGGFPQALFEVEYPAPGSPTLAALTRESVASASVELTHAWGLDHGSWSVLCRMFPGAQIPVVQLSLDRTQPASFHHALGKELGSLRERGVLVLGSGNIVHNLRRARWEDSSADWALAFDALVAERILAGDDQSLVDYHRLGAEAALAIPTNEHYLPLLYLLAMRRADEPVRFFNERVTLSTISMRSFQLG